MSSEPQGGVQRIGTDSQGRTVLIAPYDEDLASKAVQKGLGKQTDSDPETTTPDPTGESDGRDEREGGPIRRFNDVFTDLGMVQLEALAMDGYEIARATNTLRDETFRNEFPLLIPRFAVTCEACGVEYNEEVEACLECTRERLIEEGVDSDPPRDLDLIDEEFHEGTLRPPEARQKRSAEQLFESVNKEGQSLRELYKLCEDDHHRVGVGMHIVKWDYAIATGDSNVFSPGDVIYQQHDELVKADPKRVVPVVDENGRIGNFWWACPVHRPPHSASVVEKAPGRCPECSTQLQEVYYVEKQDGSRSTRKPVKYYFDHEVVDWAHHFPRLNGKDGLSPAHHVWLKQSILHWMDVYGAAFYDPSSDRYPNKFMVVHTTNPDTWERNFEKAEDDAKENPYAQQIMMNEYGAESQSTPEVQVIDLMNDELLGQDDTIKKRYKSDIRQQWMVTDVFDSELEDAGGLNNEGKQLEVTDRGVASRHQDLMTGPLDELGKLLGITDYRIAFVPQMDATLEEQQQKVKLGTDAAKGGLEPRWEDGEVEIPDGEFEEPDTGGPPIPGMASEDGDTDAGELNGGDPESLFGDFSEGDLASLTSKLDDAYDHMVWADEDTKAESYWADDDRVPEFVKEAITRVIDSKDAVFKQIEGLTPAGIMALEELFKEKLTQPQGWSIKSISEDIQDTFLVDEETADTWAATESARILNKTREEAFKSQPTDDGEEERTFRWIGPGSPDDGRTTDACVWMKEQTDPAFGGTPRTLEELHDLAAEAVEKFFSGLSYNRDWVLHPHERHTFTEDFSASKAEYGPDLPLPWTFEPVEAGA